MKKILLSLAIIATSFATKAQTFISTSHEKICYYNSETKKYDKSCTEIDKNTLFTVNKDETVMHHTTAAISSDYYVQSNYADVANKTYSYSVKSDAGNSYYFVIDLSAYEFKIYNFNSGYVITHSIKRAWSE